MSERKGEKYGWTLGFMGGFLWILLLSCWWTYQGRIGPALSGYVLFGLALALIILLAPWRHPLTPAWKLLIPIYGVFLLSVVVAFWGFAEPGVTDFSPWLLLWLLPTMTPFFTVGGRKWTDGEA